MASAEESVPENSRDGTDHKPISRDQTVNDVQAGHDRKAVDGKRKSSGSKKITNKKSGKKKRRKTRTKREQVRNVFLSFFFFFFSHRICRKVISFEEYYSISM